MINDNLQLSDEILAEALGMLEVGYAPRDIAAIFPAHREELVGLLELALLLSAEARSMLPDPQKLVAALATAPAPRRKRSFTHLSLPIAALVTAWLFFLSPSKEADFAMPEAQIAALREEETAIDDVGHEGQVLATQEQADDALDEYLAAASS